jgi:hypothetical protein
MSRVSLLPRYGNILPVLTMEFIGFAYTIQNFLDETLRRLQPT